MAEQKDSWTPGIEYILEEIRLNAITVSDYHKDRYYHQKGHLKYFRIPTIILAAMNSVFSVGLQPYCPQPTISILCCFISMMCGIISSIELFLSIQATMEKELIASKDFYLLSVDIFKMLYLERETRMVNGKTYLDEIYQTYCKLIENSNLVKQNMKNMIGPVLINNKTIDSLPNNPSFNSLTNDIELGDIKDSIQKSIAIHKRNTKVKHIKDVIKDAVIKEPIITNILNDTVNDVINEKTDNISFLIKDTSVSTSVPELTSIISVFIPDEVITNEVLITNEVKTNEVITDEIEALNEVITDEVITDEVITNEVITDETLNEIEALNEDLGKPKRKYNKKGK
jgi:hypothetical protein